MAETDKTVPAKPAPTAMPKPEQKTKAEILVERVTALRGNLITAAETIAKVQGEVSGKERKVDAPPVRAGAHAHQVEGFFPIMDHLLGDIERLTEDLNKAGRDLKSAF